MFRIDKDNEKAPLAEVTFEKGTFAGQTFKGDLIPCRDVTCQCDKIYVQFANGAQKYDLWLDTYNKSANANIDEENEQVPAFVNSLNQEVSQDDWEELQKLYYLLKLAGTEMIDPGLIRVTFDEAEVEEGVMVNYNQLLPYGVQLEFSLGETNYKVDTLYCVRLNCACTVTNFLFHELKDGDPADSESPMIAYDYVTRKHSVESRGRNVQYTPEELWNGLKESVPELSRFSKERHKRLKAMYKSYLIREAVPSKPRKASGIAPAMVPASKPAGRNDPCPCGSGKKYKKCCGA